MDLRTPSPLLRYASAVAAVILAIGARLLLDPWLEDRLAFAFQYLALAFAAWYGGFGPAILAMVVGSLATRYFILAPRGSFSLENDQQVWAILRYFIDGFAIALLGYALGAVRQRTGALRSSEARYRQLVEFSLDAIWIHTEDQLVYMNPEAVRVFGVTDASALLGRPVDEIIHPDERERARGRRAMMRSTGQRAPLTVMKFLRADGKTVLLEVRATPIEYEGQASIVAVGRDVTERVRLEEQLHQAQKLEAVGQLTGGIAHDFNNMLTGIIGSLDLMQRYIANGRADEIGRFTDAAVSSANRAAALTHRLLAFSRRQSLDRKTLDVNELIHSLEDLIRRTKGDPIELKLRLADNVWPVSTDVSQLENALLNLVINARDAMPDGGELLIETANVYLDGNDITTLEPVKAGDYLMLAVSDNGTGMTPSVRSKAFDPFFTTKPIGQGTGLGLSMIYGFAQQSGGHVSLDSLPGQGTCVRLYLPRLYALEAELPAIEAVAEAPAVATGETVVVVEDDPAVRMLVMDLLKELGYRAHEAEDAKGALPLLESDLRVDLLVTDVGLPGMNGRQMAEIARQHRPGLKVLFMTGYAQKAAERQGFLEDGMDMVAKPFSIEQLAGKIRTMISQNP